MEKAILFLQYRGKLTEKFEHALKRIEAPCKVIMTLRKLKTVLPSLKAPVEKSLKSGVVYEICCSRCNSRYVGQSSRHLTTRIKEHSRVSAPVGSHFLQCGVKLTLDDVKILATSQTLKHLMILEAIFINDTKPVLNTKDEYKSHTLVIKF